MPTEIPRVLHVIARLNTGGTARYLAVLLPALEKEFISALLAVGSVQANETEDETLNLLRFTRIKHLGRKINPLHDIQAYIELRKVVKDFKPDIIHSHTFKAGFLTRLMYLKIPKIHTFHGHLLQDPEFSNFSLRVIVNLERMLALVTKKLVTVGEQVALDLQEVGIGQKNRYVSIGSELGEMKFSSRADAKSKFLISDKPCILWMARVVPVKNPSLLLEVARLLPQYEFLMCGDGSMLESLLEVLPGNLRALGWQEATDVMPCADLFLSTSLNEGMPYSILEARACGLPVIAVHAGAIKELVNDGEDGFLVTADANEIAKKILVLLENPEKRIIFGERARQDSLEKISINSKAKKHKALYLELLEKQ
jgi:glycosyltransferase involved in cell wall biosynthesis